MALSQIEIPGLFSPMAPSVACVIERRDKAEHDTLCSLLSIGYGHNVAPYVRRLFDTFDVTEAINRSALFKVLGGAHGMDGWSIEDAEYVGLYDRSIYDYHVIWDRKWAIYLQVPRMLVPKVWKCSYGSPARFYDRDGALLFTSVYTRDGKILTHDERRQALAEMAGGAA